MRRMSTLAITMIFVAVAATAQPGASKAKGTQSSRSKEASPDKMAAMQQAIEVQQAEILELKEEVQQLQNRNAAMEHRIEEAQNAASTAAAASAQQKEAVASVRDDVLGLKTNITTTALTLQESQKPIAALENPLSIRFRGIAITPGGYLAAETVWRKRGLAADVNTPFNSVPFPGSSEHNLSELFGSGRQSRISILNEGRVRSAKLSGYVEGDFLSAGTTSSNNQSDGYTLRQRQAWGQAALDSGWTFTGGQMWSLVTETKYGVGTRTEAVPMTIDAQYNVGFSWARQYGFRVAKALGNHTWLAFAVENPQTTVDAHGASDNFLLGATGNSGGLYNPTANYSLNVAPDLVFKTVSQSSLGHYEVFALLSQFRDRIFPNAIATTPSAAGAFNNNAVGGGVGANARWSLLRKHLDVGIHAFGGNGVGRYGSSGLPDATVRPNGTLALIRNYQGLATLEHHWYKWDFYANAGDEYAGRASYLNSLGGPVGYGSPLFDNSGCFTETLPSSSNGFTGGTTPSTCTGDTRNIVEGTLGFWHRFYNGPAGRVQFGAQYSYLFRGGWVGMGGAPRATENRVFTSFRYYLP
jgi:hypothetical protein